MKKKIKYGEVSEEVVRKLEEAVGAENVTTAPEDLICYSRDAAIYKHLPDVAVRPLDTAQVSSVLKLANKYRIPVTPRGGGSGLAGAAIPLLGGIMLDMSGMNKILSVSIEDQTALVEAGVVCESLNNELMKHGFFFPPDPSSDSICTIGGMVNNNASGNRAVKYGSTRDYTLWLEVVLPSGEIINTGSKTLKSVSGLDLTRLFVGSEGSLGVVTKVCLKIWPMPKYYGTAVFIYDSIAPLARAAAKIRSAGIVPEMIEFMDRKTTKLALEYAGVKGIPEGNFMLVDVGGGREHVERTLNDIFEICIKEKPQYSEKTMDAHYREKLITARKSALPSLAKLRPSIMLEDCTLPLSKLPEAAVKIEEIPRRLGVPGLDLGNFGHIGDGNLHPTFVFDEREEEEKEAFLKGLDILYKEIVLPLGGSITAEHGIGIAKAPYIGLEHGPAVKWMHAIKRLFDPKLILNPGKGKGGPYPIEAIKVEEVA